MHWTQRPVYGAILPSFIFTRPLSKLGHGGTDFVSHGAWPMSVRSRCVTLPRTGLARVDRESPGAPISAELPAISSGLTLIRAGALCWGSPRSNTDPDLPLTVIVRIGKARSWASRMISWVSRGYARTKKKSGCDRAGDGRPSPSPSCRSAVRSRRSVELVGLARREAGRKIR